MSAISSFTQPKAQSVGEPSSRRVTIVPTHPLQDTPKGHPTSSLHHPVPSPQPPGPPTISRYDLASPWRRIGAVVIDGFVWAILVILIGYLIAGVGGDGHAAGDDLMFDASFHLVGGLRLSHRLALYGRSGGNLRPDARQALAEDQDRVGPRPGEAGLVEGDPPMGHLHRGRRGAIVGGLVNCLVAAVGLVLLWVDQWRQTVHDTVADTLVVMNDVASGTHC